MEHSKQKALVVLSGGQDSTTCLHWTLNRYADVRAVTFDYGQKHLIELEAAQQICHNLSISYTIINCSAIK